MSTGLRVESRPICIDGTELMRRVLPGAKIIATNTVAAEAAV